MTNTSAKQRRPYGNATVRQETRKGKLVWGYDKTLRQPDGKLKRFRKFSFRTKADAERALDALKEANTKTGHSLKSAEQLLPTTVGIAVASYQKLAAAKLVINRTSDTTYWRARPGHLHTLDRFVEWIGRDRLVNSIILDDFIYWTAAETERAEQQGKTLEQSTLKRGLNTIRAALSHAVESGQFNDLHNYRVPQNPLKKKIEKDRDRVLTDDEIDQICRKLAENPKYDEALFFFQLDIITGARMAELLRMKWDESSVRFGTVKLFSTKTGKWRTIKAPIAAELIAKRRERKLGGPTHVLTQSDQWFRDVFQEVSNSLGIVYGQRVLGGWTIHDLRHTCLTHFALEGVPLHAIKEYAGHLSIVETQRYLKYMPQQIELAANISSRLAELANAKIKPATHPHVIECPKCGFTFDAVKEVISNSPDKPHTIEPSDRK